MNIMEPAVFIFCALECEAKPLLNQYGLKKWRQPHSFAIYRAEDRVLVVSGVGKTAMAGAVGYAMAIFQPLNPVLINLGIAGHRDIPTGSLVMADTVIDADNQEKRFYPQWIGRWPCQSRPLSTLAQPDFSYSGDSLYDMEGAAFYQIALKFSSSELIHCIKVISDNLDQSAKHINAKAVSSWVAKQLPATDAIIARLLACRQQTTELPPKYYQSLIERYHFSVSGRIKLKSLLQRWEVVSDRAPLTFDQQAFSDAKQLLRWLERQIAGRSFYL
ncbi:hypothetical protein Q9L42_006235 [Methylomarinum sp. Ch1-1]|uniref:Nucleoside phosphorylase domain-containing protein n=1 Tax=Methylomarinum roseum TaxID=3067653 RepID=A0AAU7NXR1_9GAMM|nr:hypothetical protein [Methylomarinum sp. Ch1-1]MDP4522186.1 hypothetical protein [Methylomarinum sp. Ch1-1]